MFVNQLDKHMPRYLRRKVHPELKQMAQIFEIQPTSGVLDPGEKSNVQVKFMPKEEVSLKATWLLSDSVVLLGLYFKAHACFEHQGKLKAA